MTPANSYPSQAAGCTWEVHTRKNGETVIRDCDELIAEVYRECDAKLIASAPTMARQLDELGSELAETQGEKRELENEVQGWARQHSGMAARIERLEAALRRISNTAEACAGIKKPIWLRGILGEARTALSGNGVQS